MKLGAQTKGDFQAYNFIRLAEKMLEAGVPQGQSSHALLMGILSGLSDVWDSAEKQSDR